MLFMFFFFKQKTAYELRVSDWSSDVCSSDLQGFEWWRWRESNPRPKALHPRHYMLSPPLDLVPRQHGVRSAPGNQPVSSTAADRRPPRSEEHTSELQSLMRISYAVFCLKKNNKITCQHQSDKQENTHDINIY